ARLICVIVGRKQGLDVFNGFFELGSLCNPASSTSSKALLFFPFIHTCGVYYYGYVLKLGMGFDFPQCLDSALLWHSRIEQNYVRAKHVCRLTVVALMEIGEKLRSVMNELVFS